MQQLNILVYEYFTCTLSKKAENPFNPSKDTVLFVIVQTDFQVFPGYVKTYMDVWCKYCTQYMYLALEFSNVHLKNGHFKIQGLGTNFKFQMSNVRLKNSPIKNGFSDCLICFLDYRKTYLSYKHQNLNNYYNE